MHNEVNSFFIIQITFLNEFLIIIYILGTTNVLLSSMSIQKLIFIFIFGVYPQVLL